MSKFLIVIFALLAVTLARVGNNGQVTLNYIRGTGYTLPVDFSKNALRSNNMVLALYSSNVLLSNKCLNYDKYNCNQFNCNKDPRTFSVNYPYFTAQGNLASTSVHVDYNNWSLAKNAPTLIASLCSAPVTEITGRGASGLLGLGVDGIAQSNFKFAQSFSIFFNQAFRLIFNPTALPPANFRLNPIAKVRTDANWKVPNVQAVAFKDPRNPAAKPLRNPLTGVSAIFDINSDAIALPLPVYQAVIGAFASFGVACPQGVLNKPICNYNGLTQNLPNFEVQAEQNIIITPQMFALLGNGRQFTLNFKATSPTLQGINYVTPDYQYTIILGNTVLGGYFTHFSIAERAVSLYQVL